MVRSVAKRRVSNHGIAFTRYFNAYAPSRGQAWIPDRLSLRRLVRDDIASQVLDLPGFLSLPYHGHILALGALWAGEGLSVRYLSRSRRGSPPRAAQEAVGPVGQLHPRRRHSRCAGHCGMARLGMVGNEKGPGSRRRL